MIDVIKCNFDKFCVDQKDRPKLTFLDPPDNIGLDYNGYSDNLDTMQYEGLLGGWLTKACRITDGPVFISFNEHWTHVIEGTIEANKEEIKLVQRLYWSYTFGQNCRKKYTPCIRPIYWLNDDTIYPDTIKVPSARQVKYKDKRAKAGGRLPSNVWDFSRICGTFKERRPHVPTQHPEALMRRIILGHSQPGELVLDPFCGTGTTAIVCKREGRRCLTMDVDQSYVDKAIEYLDGMDVADERIQGTTDPK